ncbi:MAG: porin family protein [Candidatus Liberibacter ctenarytainae]|uniref:Porin family protein n=1 Tax=Candidatus Liberibacter ctenarytainae TaxID=2020335 RepID=A0A937DGX6_9HYPH|nr:porin family protein [Candidatus Liberibacter ctenarytainae]
MIRKFFIAAGVSGLSLASFCSAQAADIGPQKIRTQQNSGTRTRGVVPTTAIPQNFLTQNWEGIFAGINIKGDVADNFYKTNPFYVGSGIFGAMNWEDDGIVWGGEADVSYKIHDMRTADIKEGHTIGASGSIRGRIGYDIDPVMVFVTAGPVASQKHPAEGQTDIMSKIAIGAAAGVGVETFLTNNITARAEYRANMFFKSTEKFDHAISIGFGMKI